MMLAILVLIVMCHTMDQMVIIVILCSHQCLFCFVLCKENGY